MSSAHDLKCWPEFYRDILSGHKTFEVRKNDRSFQLFDLLRLREYQPASGEPCTDDFTGYTGRSAIVRVTYILHGTKDSPSGLPEGVCVMAIKPLP